MRQEFETIIDGLSDALDFSRTIGADAAASIPYELGGGRGTLGEVDFYTSHEGLMLGYESALTRELPVPPSIDIARSASATANTTAGAGAVDADASRPAKAHYNTGAHFLWIGDRTRQLTGAHVEYFRGIRNPIGIKVGPSMQADELVKVLDGESQ
uniref:Phospho-2-dehydro-3-deoxyheptonate aldolase n=1 Tax=Psilocybe cubensis TaxID=181762 RepID=A0A8H8CQP0_PSICU